MKVSLADTSLAHSISQSNKDMITEGLKKAKEVYLLR